VLFLIFEGSPDDLQYPHHHQRRPYLRCHPGRGRGAWIARKSDIAKGLGFGVCVSVILFVLQWGLLEWLGGV